MGTSGRVSIDQWLANVSPGDLGGDNSRGMNRPGELLNRWHWLTGHVTDRDCTNAFVSNEGSHLPRLPLETPSTAPTPQRPRLNKRRRDEPDGGSGPPHRSDKKKIHSYDRNPRRKTREDRYKYQTTGMISGQVHGERNPKRTKTLRRTRKQTTNAGFHAPNVARDRLTLQPLAMIGIFSKGKSSPPIRLRQDQYRDTRNDHRSVKLTGFPPTVSGLAFSETTLSFGMKQIPPKSSTPDSVVLGSLEMGHHTCGKRVVDCSDDKRSPKLVMNPPNSGSIKSTNAHNENLAITANLREFQELSRPRLIFPAATHQGNCAQQWGLEANQQYCLPESRSATPYTWSESEPYQPRLDRSIEDTLLAVFHINLQAEISESSKTADMNQRYYELKDLQEILEARRELWEEGRSGGYPATCLSSHSISRPNHAASISQSGWNGTSNARRMIEEALTDSDHIFQQLDMLFQEIVSSQDGRPAPEGEQLEIPPPRPGPPHSLKTYFDTFPSNNSKEARCDRLHMAPCDGIGLDNDTSGSLRGTLSGIRVGTSLGPSSSCNKNDFPTFLPIHPTDQQLQSQQQSFTERPSRRGRPAAQSTLEQNTFPLGFWRQNKLY
ncbi:hypothetical protein N7481_012181 [Penicillium waksmanii]|uniref:uncharacterized protein n=1 Tax=Penicillium waksmanii TaxID=69791 RepID=UPI0025468385|nr:uncharacterized protein N7481_012181 [Penicillium waksmanii]KAJ5965467.1 hypothetical protein N7481_012181 [Penicillium waksmanii]